MSLIYLENKKIIREYLYAKSEYDFKESLIKEIDKSFLLSVNEILEHNSDLKLLYDERISRRINSKIELSSKQDTEGISEGIWELDNSVQSGSENDPQHTKGKSNENPFDDKIKTIYRKIVKITHPDNTNSVELNNIYIRCNEYYKSNDIVSLYEICDQLGIDYDVDYNEKETIQNMIVEIKSRSKFLENNLSWKWYNSDFKTKDKIVIDYLKRELFN